MAKEKAQKIPTINKLDNRIVSEHNDLIRSTANMTSLSLKLFEIAVSAMDSREKQPSHEVRINKEQIYNALGIKGTSKNQQLSKALNTLRKSSNFEITTEQNGEIHDIGITPVYYADNNYSSDYAVIRFAPEILPFITDLKKNFTQYQLNDILHLKNKYAVSMYRWFTMNYRQYEYYANSGKRREDQIEKYANPEITLEELRKLTGTEKKYSAFYDVRRYIIDPICNEITKHTKYNITYDRIKSGRKVVAIKFHISKKGEKKVEKDSVVSVSLADFLQNRYSQLLIGAGLLVGTLYPAYDKFLKNADITDLDNHLHYVAQNMKQKPDNLARYLAKAIANYSEKRKQQKPKNSKGSANKKSKGTHVEEKKPAWLKATEYLKAQGFSEAEMDNNKRALELLINHFGKDSEQVTWYTHAYKNASKADIEALKQRIANRKKK